jgi:hypothetical protein
MTGNSALDAFAIAGIIAAGLGLLFVLARIGRRLWKVVQLLDDFFDDWRGCPARPGVPARVGVMERLDTIEHEVQANDGSSLKDAVKRVESKLDTHLDNLED